MLRAAEPQAARVGAMRIVAVLKPDNVASRRAFEAAGDRGFTMHDQLTRCERRIAPYP